MSLNQQIVQCSDYASVHSNWTDAIACISLMCLRHTLMSQLFALFIFFCYYLYLICFVLILTKTLKDVILIRPPQSDKIEKVVNLATEKLTWNVDWPKIKASWWAWFGSAWATHLCFDHVRRCFSVGTARVCQRTPRGDGINATMISAPSSCQTPFVRLSVSVARTMCSRSVACRVAWLLLPTVQPECDASLLQFRFDGTQMRQPACEQSQILRHVNKQAQC